MNTLTPAQRAAFDAWRESPDGQWLTYETLQSHLLAAFAAGVAHAAVHIEDVDDIPIGPGSENYGETL
jgi:hypothetical protein